MPNYHWYRVANEDDLPDGQVKTVWAGDTAICLIHHEGQFYALDDVCPHEGSSLGEGHIENGYVVCPHHGWEFCPRDGHLPDYYMEDPTTTYPVDVRADGIYIGIAAD